MKYSQKYSRNYLRNSLQKQTTLSTEVFIVILAAICNTFCTSLFAAIFIFFLEPLPGIAFAKLSEEVFATACTCVFAGLGAELIGDFFTPVFEVFAQRLLSGFQNGSNSGLQTRGNSSSRNAQARGPQQDVHNRLSLDRCAQFWRSGFQASLY